MLKLGTQRLLIIIIGLTMLGQSVSAMPPTPRPPEPVILSTAVDSKNELMTISGRNFGNYAPIVRLGGQIVVVESFSPTRIVVRLPSDIRLATYLLTVSTTGTASISVASFNTVIFSVVER
jgi:IPT/TIG domain